ncbi:MAG: SDR family oxidoreductase [Acidobacteria bacterium]|nr:SDR family oxidoreductase [Acidobacteriota bacterium]
MSSDIRGLVVIVTGASLGIGATYSRFLASAGVKVVMADIDESSLKALAGEIEKAGGTVVPIRVDVSSEEDTQRMARVAVESFGRVDGLINNAALFSALLPKRSTFDIDAATWDRVMAVNIKGPFLCCRAVLPQMQKQKSGSIVNISSNTVLSGVTGLLHYVTSKSAQVGFTRSLAREFGPDGIRVNVIMPGLVETTMVRERYSEADQQRAVAMRSIGRPQHADDLNGIIAFLLSQDSAFITGQTFNVDGGALFH